MTCKAYDLDEAMAAIAPAVTGDCAVAPLLNGVRHIDALTARFGRHHVMGGLTAVNAVLLPDGRIVQSPVRIEMTAFGELDGKVSERCLAIQKSFADGGIKADASGAILAAMWAKLIGFATIAAVATLCRARAGAIARASTSRALVDATLDECSRIAEAEGFLTPDAIRSAARGLFSQPDSTYGPVNSGRHGERPHHRG